MDRKFENKLVTICPLDSIFLRLWKYNVMKNQQLIGHSYTRKHAQCVKDCTIVNL